jgi:hypothetical protein
MQMMPLPLMASGLPLGEEPESVSAVGSGHLPVQDYPAVGELAVEQDSVLVSVNPSRAVAIDATTLFATS